MDAALSLVWAIAVAATAFVAARWTAGNDIAVTLPDRSAMASRGHSSNLLASSRWWTIPVGLAGARLLGDGVPLWIVACFAAVLGILDELLGRRVILIIGLPAAVALSFLLALGTGCLTGFGISGHLIVPAAVIGSALAIMAKRPRPTITEPQRWRPELVARVAIVAVEWVAVPWRAALDLQAAAQHWWVVAGAVAIAAAIAAWAGRVGHAVAGLGLGVVVMSIALVAGPRVCAGQPATTLVAIGCTAVGAALAGAIKSYLN